MSYNIAEILRFFSITKKSPCNALHLNITLNDNNLHKDFELSLQNLQFVSLNVRSLTFSLETSRTPPVEDLILNKFPAFFSKNLTDLDFLEIVLLYEDFAMLPFILEIFQNLTKITNFRLVLTKISVSHWTTEFFLLPIPYIREFFSKLCLNTLETPIGLLNNFNEIHKNLLILTLDVHAYVLSHEILKKLRLFPNLLRLSLFLVDSQAFLDFFSPSRLREFQECIENFLFIIEINIIQGDFPIILNNKRYVMLQSLIQQLIRRPYLLKFEAKGFEPLLFPLFEIFNDAEPRNHAKSLFSSLKTQVIPQRLRLFYVLQALLRTNLKKTYKRKEILCEILSHFTG